MDARGRTQSMAINNIEDSRETRDVYLAHRNNVLGEHNKVETREVHSCDLIKEV